MFTLSVLALLGHLSQGERQVMRLTHDTGRHIKKYTLDPSDQLRFPALARERPRLPLEGKLSPQVTDEVCWIL